MMYKMPVLNMKNVLKKDREVLKKLSQTETSRAQLHTLLEDIESPDYLPPLVRPIFHVIWTTFHQNACKNLTSDIPSTCKNFTSGILPNHKILSDIRHPTKLSKPHI